MPHQLNLDGTNANNLQLYISISGINFNQELGHLKFSLIWNIQYALLGHYIDYLAVLTGYICANLKHLANYSSEKPSQRKLVLNI